MNEVDAPNEVCRIGKSLFERDQRLQSEDAFIAPFLRHGPAEP